MTCWLTLKPKLLIFAVIGQLFNVIGQMESNHFGQIGRIRNYRTACVVSHLAIAQG